MESPTMGNDALVSSNERKMFFSSGKSMTTNSVWVRLARWYALSLLMLEMSFLMASVLLHISVMLGTAKLYIEYGLWLFRGTILLAALVTPFVHDNLRCKEQIQKCPDWMWKGALILGIYVLLLVLQMVCFPQGSSLEDQHLLMSGSPLVFDLMAICILYSVLWRGYLETRELIRRFSHSLSILILGGTLLLLYRLS